MSTPKVGKNPFENPLWKHPLLWELPEGVRENPTLEDIKKVLQKKLKRQKLLALVPAVLAAAFLVGAMIRYFYSYSDLSKSTLSYMMFLTVITVLSAIYMWRQASKRYVMLDEEILREIRNHERWASE